MPKNRSDLTDEEKTKRLAALAKSRGLETTEEEEEEDHPEEEEHEDEGSESDGSSDEAEGGEPAADGASEEDDVPEHKKDDEDEEPSGDMSPEEERRAKKRQEKKERRERARAAREADQRLIQSLTTQLQEQNRRLAGLEKNSHQSTIAGIDDAIRKEEQNFHLAAAKMAAAVKSQDDKAFAAALIARDESRDRWLNLKNNRTRLETLERSAGRPSMPKQVVLDHARKFADENKWYDVQGRNEDSQIVLAIDQTLTNAGFSPETPQYWQELRNRVKKYLPHRYQGAGAKNGDAAGGRPKVKGKPGSFGAGMRSGSPGKGGVVISKARQEAILALGIERGTKEWDNMVKEYQQYDKTNASQSRR